MEKKENTLKKDGSEKKLSYVELENVANQLSLQAQRLAEQNKQLQQKLQEVGLDNFFNRLEWLYKVIDGDNMYLSDDFKHKCAEEFEKMMTYTPEDSDNTKEETKE